MDVHLDVHMDAHMGFQMKAQMEVQMDADTDFQMDVHWDVQKYVHPGDNSSRPLGSTPPLGKPRHHKGVTLVG